MELCRSECPVLYPPGTYRQLGLTRAISGSMSLQQPVSLFLSMCLLPLKVVLCPGSRSPPKCLRAILQCLMLTSIAIIATWDASESRKLKKNRPWSMVLLQPQSVLMSLGHVATKGHKDIYVLRCQLWP